MTTETTTQYSSSKSRPSIFSSETSTFYAWFVVVIGGLFYCYAYFLRVAPSDMMANLLHHFNIDAAMFGNLAAFYYYSYTPMQLPVGFFIDRYGARLILFTACLIATLGVFLFTIADNFYFAAAGRFLVGFGSAFAYISVLKLATIWLPPNRFATVAGGTTAIGMSAAIFSDIYLGEFVEKIGYQHALFSSIGAGVILSIIIFAFVRNRPTLTTSSSRTLPTFKEVMQGFLKMTQSKQMWLIGIVGLLLYMPASVFLDVWGIPYLESSYHLNPMEASQIISMVFVGWIISAPTVGWLSDKIKRRRLPLTIAAFGAAILSTIIFYVPGIATHSLYLLFFMFGLFAGAHPLIFSLSRENNPDALSGTSTAITNFVVMLGGVIFQPFVGWLLVLHWSGAMELGIPIYSVEDYHFALSILTIGLFVAGLLTFAIKETYCSIKESL